MMKFLLTKLLSTLLILALSFNLHAQVYPLDTIQYNGNSNKYINLVFVGDGFQSGELDTYKTNVQTLTDYLFSISPFMEYKKYFNVFAIRVPSGESGANHPGTAGDESSSGGQPVLTVNTYFNSTFDFASIHRLLVPQDYLALYNTMISNFPLYDQALVIVNTPYYGGSGGGVATSSLHTSAYEVLVHEIGHSFAGLADEYYAGDSYFAEKPNMTQETNPALVKWKNWMGEGGVGIYQYCCGGNSALWYKPHEGCKMQFLGVPFCPICKETIVESIHGLIGSPIIGVSPPVNAPVIYCAQPLSFKLNLIKPSPATLQVTWLLNGTEVPSDNDSILVSNSGLLTGKNILVARVLDITPLSRSDQHPLLHTYSSSWTIYKDNVYRPVISVVNDTTGCVFGSVTMVASLASSYLWNTGDTSQVLKATSTGNYFVTTTDAGGCSGTSAPVELTEIPKSTFGPDTSIIIICSDETVDITKIYSSSGFSIDWGTEAPMTTPKGNYRLIATSAVGCIDTANLTIRQQISTWTGAISSNWHVAANWSANSVPDSKTHVIIRGNSINPCIISEQDAGAASLQLTDAGAYQLINNRKLLLSGKCSVLPVE